MISSSNTGRLARTVPFLLAALFLFPALAARAQTVTLFPAPVTTGINQTQDFIATVTGTNKKAVKVSVCDDNGQNCAGGGNATVGTVAVVGQDAKKNRILRYTAPASVPAPPACATVAAGCRVTLKVRLKAFPKSDKIKIIISSSATNPVPLLISMAPSSAASEDPAFTLTVTGSGFIATSVVRWNGSDRTTTFGSDTQLTADIPSADLDIPEPGVVTVFNDAPEGGESNSLNFSIGSGPPRLVERSSRDSSGVEGSAASGAPAASGSGRYLAFASDADNLVASDGNGVTDVFWRDACLGEDGCTLKTRRVSVSTAGVEGNAASSDPAITNDGRFVAFLSLANNLVSSDTNGARDVFVRDTCTGAGLGCTPATTRVSVSTGGAEGDNGSATAPAITPDGRFVAFDSAATNLVANDLNGVRDIFVRDTCRGAGGGCTPSTIRVSVASNGTEGNNASSNPAISNSGRFVAFGSDADNLVGNDANGVSDIFVRDTCIGASGCTPSTIRLSRSTSGTEGNAGSSNPSMSGNGRYIAFASDADNLIGNDANGVRDVFVRDTCQGASGCSVTTRRVSVSTAGTAGNATSVQPSISGDGRFVVFASDSDNLVASDTNGTRDVFLRDTCNGAPAGCSVATLRLSVTKTGLQVNGANTEPSISRDGHFICFTSGANNVVASDNNGVADVFLGRTGR